LAKAPRTLEEIIRATINQNGKVSRGNARKNPLSPFSTKTASPQNIKEKIPVDVIISLFQIQFAQNTRNPRFKPAIEPLVG
jgi:hypothetical protein